MSLGAALRRTLNVRRSPAPVSRAMLDLDAGDLLTPTAYPYGPGQRPVRPFVSRVVNPGRGERPTGQLYPPDGNPTQRTFAHIDYLGHAAASRAGARDASGVRSTAKITRTRPWLFAGGSSATTAAKLASGASVATPSGACADCD